MYKKLEKHRPKSRLDEKGFKLIWLVRLGVARILGHDCHHSSKQGISYDVDARILRARSSLNKKSKVAKEFRRPR